ncbi:MAG: hypothetical protein CMI16_03385 [Opitutaceae bacterium]|nr:hypothetical protein [Opitutaceae bacterium]|tara:strand:+ start:204 stop:701 length:498 start_codon:yes stop_codon:yes gene_type:complete
MSDADRSQTDAQTDAEHLRTPNRGYLLSLDDEAREQYLAELDRLDREQGNELVAESIRKAMRATEVAHQKKEESEKAEWQKESAWKEAHERCESTTRSHILCEPFPALVDEGPQMDEDGVPRFGPPKRKMQCVCTRCGATFTEGSRQFDTKRRRSVSPAGVAASE